MNQKKSISYTSIIKNKSYICTPIHTNDVKNCSGCSAVRLAYLLWEQGVAGSNPASPTSKNPSYVMYEGFFAFKRLSV